MRDLIFGEVLAQHCERVGRDPSTIEKSVNLTLARSEDDLRERFGGMASWIQPSALMGSAQEIIDRVGEYRDAGADWAIVAMRPPFDVDGLDQFAADVLPALS